MKVLFASLFLFIALPLRAQVVEKTMVYKAGGKIFEGFVAYPQNIKGKSPGILVVHDWLGVTDKTKDKARDLAKLGYVAFAADIYTKGVRPGMDVAGQEAGKYKKDRKLFREHLNYGLDELTRMPQVDGQKLAAIGFCFGGTGVLELARTGAPLKGVVSFHGGLDSPDPSLGKNIKGKVLALHGADDPFVSAQDLAAFEEEMRKNNVDWQIIKYGGAVHSFTDKTAGTDNSKGAAYNLKADKRSWVAMKEFFSEIL